MQPDAFILVGGRSSRMGRDKALVPLAGAPLLSMGADRVSQAFPGSRVALSASDPEQLLAFAGIGLELPFVLDLHPGRGPLGGLHAALANARTPWIFVIACDLPFATPELLRHLSLRIDETADAVVPVQQDGRLQPLCAFYRVGTCLGVVEKLLAANRPTPSMHAFVESIDTRRVPWADIAGLPGAPNFFCNVNTADDLEQAERDIHHRDTDGT